MFYETVIFMGGPLNGDQRSMVVKGDRVELTAELQVRDQAPIADDNIGSVRAYRHVYVRSLGVFKYDGWR